MITVISKFFFSLYHTHLNTQFCFQFMDTFFYCLSPFSEFSSKSNPHSEDLFLILRTQGSTIDSIYELLILSRAPQDSIDTTVSKSFISSSVCKRTTKITYNKKDIFYSAS